MGTKEQLLLWGVRVERGLDLVAFPFLAHMLRSFIVWYFTKSADHFHFKTVLLYLDYLSIVTTVILYSVTRIWTQYYAPYFFFFNTFTHTFPIVIVFWFSIGEEFGFGSTHFLLINEQFFFIIPTFWSFISLVYD